VAWLAAFELMEDEDDDVRDVAAGAAAAAAGVAADTQTEECLRRAFSVVATRMARWPPHERYLVRAAAGAPVKAAALRDVIAGVDLVRRLFDREADNHHAEGLLLSQLAAAALRRGGALRPCAAKAALGVALTSAEEAAAALGGAGAQQDSTASPGGVKRKNAGGSGTGDSQWAGGATNHESAFMPVCRVFLATWALAAAVGPLSEVTAARVAALDATLTMKVELGPMAGAMWAAARGALAQAAGAPGATLAGGVDGADAAAVAAEEVADASRDAFANLDPCFLLQ
jgi:hypothetical protein